jgi:LemA protein
MKMGCVVAIVLVAVVAVFALVAVGQYNGLVEAQQRVEGQWGQVENVYQRRADLIPNLQRTVEGSAAFERGTLREVVEARSRVGQVSAGADVLNDPQAFARFQAAQDQLSSALSRLLVVVERYPELRTTAAFRDMMAQLEGTENRIAVERNRFNLVAQDYNTRVRRVPAAWLIGLLGWPFQPKPYFTAQPGAAQAPKVDFGAR